MVKVPVSDAVWSTWRRYCEAAGFTMGRGIAVMIHQERATFVGEDVAGLADWLKDRESKIAARESELASRAETLDRTERSLIARERQAAAQAAMKPPPPQVTRRLR